MAAGGSANGQTDASGQGRWLALTALGVVFGDLATSPLYTLQTVVQSLGGHFTAESALGVLSLVFWTLIVTISIKYCLFVMRADNHGEGGILALMSLVCGNSLRGRAAILATMGLFGAALVYGDGVITPSISVLSALEGLDLAAPAVKPYVMPAAAVILAILFASQQFGTARIGWAFGPVMLLWLAAIAVLGALGVARHPQVIAALDPRWAFRFLIHGGFVAYAALGGVFLCITGGEALYADLGHFGKGPIRLAWFALVLPALILSYAGQTGLLLQNGAITGNPFFQLAPAWAVYPLVGLATAATIIASQAIITGSYSMTRQAIQLGWLPGMDIRQTSDKIYGQIYVPTVNWLMMAATIAITVSFRSSDRLAGAYGTAVSTTMLLTTALLFVAMTRVWRWPLPGALAAGGIFLAVDLAYFGANLLKIVQGGWLPLTLGTLIFVIMIVWRTGVEAVRAAVDRASRPPPDFLAELERSNVPRPPGTAIFMTRHGQNVPPLIVDHVRHMGALQKEVIALTVDFTETPRVPSDQRASVDQLGEHAWRVTIRFGFIEIPDIPSVLRPMKGLDPAIEIDKAIYFASRDRVLPHPRRSPIARARLKLFAFLWRNSVRAVDRFRLPRKNVVEIAREIEV